MLKSNKIITVKKIIKSENLLNFEVIFLHFKDIFYNIFIFVNIFKLSIFNIFIFKFILNQNLQFYNVQKFYFLLFIILISLIIHNSLFIMCLLNKLSPYF